MSNDSHAPTYPTKYRDLGMRLVSEYFDDYKMAGTREDELAAFLDGVLRQVAVEYRRLLTAEEAAHRIYREADTAAIHPLVQQKAFPFR